MAGLITEYEDYDAFVRAWHADDLAEHDVTLEQARDQGLIIEDETRMLWQLLGELESEELLIRIPEWLAAKKVEFVDGATPTMFVGRIDRETEKAIRVADAAAARPLMKLAHRIHHFDQGLANRVDADESRRDWLERRRRQTRREFEDRAAVTGLRDDWLPKSQLLAALRRRDA